MDERIKEHLKRLNQYHLSLSDIRKLDKEKFMQDNLYRTSSERYLHMAIESCLNIGNRLISLYQFKKPVDTPETYADIFVGMKKLGVFDDVYCQRLVKMAKFRNRLVHLYWEIDKETLYQFIQNDIDDFKLFEQKIVEYLNNNPL
ncbi:DUF86 domain-containing protein [Thermodesulfobacteriota bacterium]